MVTVPQLWPGCTMAVLATGPSLCREDVDLLRGTVRVLAVNDAYRLAPWADVLYSSDQQWWPHHKGVPSFPGLKYGILPSRRSQRFAGAPGVQLLANTGVDGLETAPHGLRTGRNSGYAAINLAFHLGAVRLLLLGYNMGPAHGKRHFFGDHVGLPNSSNYQGFIQKFDTIAPKLKARGIDVLNCTPESRLTQFPKANLRDVLQTIREVAA